MCSFLQGDSYSPVDFCISNIPVYKGKRDVKRTHSLFVDDLKVYQESHKTLKNVNEMLIPASNDTGA